MGKYLNYPTFDVNSNGYLICNFGGKVYKCDEKYIGPTDILQSLCLEHILAKENLFEVTVHDKQYTLKITDECTQSLCSTNSFSLKISGPYFNSIYTLTDRYGKVYETQYESCIGMFNDILYMSENKYITFNSEYNVYILRIYNATLVLSPKSDYIKLSFDLDKLCFTFKHDNIDYVSRKMESILLKIYRDAGYAIKNMDDYFEISFYVNNEFYTEIIYPYYKTTTKYNKIYYLPVKGKVILPPYTYIITKNECSVTGPMENGSPKFSIEIINGKLMLQLDK